MLNMNIYNKWIRERVVPVIFNDYTNHPIDASLFEKSAYHKILNDGLYISPLKIVHAAAIHYSGRFGRNTFMKFINAFIELYVSVEPYTPDGRLYFNEKENGEFQGRSSEVIAVGLSISLSEQLFDVNRNRIGLIDDSGKRCDFYFIENGLEYVIESKGRKGSIVSAVKDIFNKKIGYPNISPKYGIISKIPRGSTATTIEVVDPEFIPKKISRDELIKRLLIHYARVTALAGFRQLSNSLMSRADEISKTNDIASLENKPLTYDSAKDPRYSFEIDAKGIIFHGYFSREELPVFYLISNGYMSMFAIEKRLFETLNRQDYNSLIDYELSIEEPNRSLSVGSDGSMLLIDTFEAIMEITQ